MESASPLLQDLAQFDTATICNVIELFHVRPRNVGYMDRRIEAAFPQMPPMVGYALTAEFRSAAELPGETAYASLQDQLEAAAELPGPAILTFQDLDDPPVGATFGEVMCSIYRSGGAAGLITSGAGRDLPQVEALDFPVFIGSRICSHSYCRILGLNRPVRVGGLLVTPGDLLHGDVNGVTNIPTEIAADIPDVAREFVAAEQKLIDAAKASSLSPGEVAERQQELVETIKQLEQRVKKEEEG